MKRRLNLQQPGFTLIEVMVTVAIVAILASVAVPAYMAHVRRSARVDAAASLLQAAAQMQQYFTLNNSYAAVAGAPLPAFNPTPKHTISLAGGALAPTAATFTLQAVPNVGAPDPICGTLTITNQGVRGVSTSAVPAFVADCWTGKGQ